MIHPWKKNKDQVAYDCGFFQVHVQQSSSPVTGKEHPFYILSTRDWVNVIALTKDRKIPMVSQFRHGSGEMSLEIPGGAVDSRDGDPLDAAKRELLEETGHEAARWVELGQLRPNPAILDNTCHIYLALDAERTGELDLDEAEELEVSLHGLPEVESLIAKGGIRHALVIAAFQLFELYRRQNPSVFKD
jgi:8-oxo-dGTP pyrophosphatase MutT (NUDIX family)